LVVLIHLNLQTLVVSQVFPTGVGDVTEIYQLSIVLNLDTKGSQISHGAEQWELS